MSAGCQKVYFHDWAFSFFYKYIRKQPVAHVNTLS